MTNHMTAVHSNYICNFTYFLLLMYDIYYMPILIKHAILNYRRIRVKLYGHTTPIPNNKITMSEFLLPWSLFVC